MNLKDLKTRFRALSRDKEEDFLTVDEDLTEWLNEAVEEACIRARLIREEALPQVCEIGLDVGTHTYKLHPSVYEIISIRLQPGNGDQPRPITLKSREWMDSNHCDWRTWATTQRIPAEIAIQDDTSIRLAGYTEVDDVLLLECYRLPLNPMCRGEDAPEIHAMHHRKLVHWALHRAFGVPDSDLFDRDRSALAEREFTKYFGLRPDADARRSTRTDVVHHTYQPLI